MTEPTVTRTRNALEAGEHREMQTPPDDGQTPPSPALATRNPRLALVGRAASWLLVAAATAVALGLVAISIGPRFLPYQALVVRSGSMSPTIPTGSVVFYRKVAATHVKVGDVIVFDKPGRQNEKVTHRVFKISSAATGRYFTTKGDANGAADNWRVPAVGTGWVASFHVPTLGYVLADLQSTTARLLLLVIPALLLGLITLYEIWRERDPRRRGA
jgi:signal peptidase